MRDRHFSGIKKARKDIHVYCSKDQDKNDEHVESNYIAAAEYELSRAPIVKKTTCL